MCLTYGFILSSNLNSFLKASYFKIFHHNVYNQRKINTCSFWLTSQSTQTETEDMWGFCSETTLMWIPFPSLDASFCKIHDSLRRYYQQTMQLANVLKVL